MRLLLWLVGLSALVAALSCSLLLDSSSLQGGPGRGGSSADGGPEADGADAASAGIALADLAPALAHAVCENLNACYVSASEVLIHDEDCQALFSSVLTGQVVAPVQESLARGLVTYDPIEAAACVQNLVEGTQKTPPQCVDFNAVVENCKRMLGKLAGVNRPCRHRYECDKGLLCDAKAGCPGTCRRFAQIGAACVEGDCDPGEQLYCQKLPGDAGTDLTAAGTCQPFVAINGDCMQNRDQCVSGAFCIDKKCRRVSDVFTLAETFTCYTNGLLCQKGLFCEFNGLPFLTMGTCVKEKRALDPCKVALPEECPKDTYCSANGFNLGGQCVASPVTNQKCATDFEQNIGLAAPCKAGLVCIDGICKPSRQLTESCEVPAQCYSSACNPPPGGGPSVCVAAGCP